MKRRDFIAGATIGVVAGSAGAVAATEAYRAGRPNRAPGAPAIVSGREVGTTWKVQTSWPGGVGLEVFEQWCNSIVEKSGGEIAFTPYGGKDLVGEFQLFDAVQNGVLDAMNPFTLYWAGRMPAAVFLSSYPMALRQAHEWEVFFYGLGGLELARSLFAQHGMHYVGPILHGANIIHSKVPIRSIDDFRDRRMRVPGGMVAELFQAAGAKTTLLPGSKIFGALESDTIDAADYVGPAVNYALGFHKVTRYISMGPPGLMSVYQPVDLMDLTVGMASWNALSPRLQNFIEREVQLYSQAHYAAIESADHEAWPRFEAAGSEITRLSASDVERFTRLAVPLWFSWANKDPGAAQAFKIQLEYMMTGSLGYVTPEMIDGQHLKWV